MAFGALEGGTSQGPLVYRKRSNMGDDAIIESLAARRVRKEAGPGPRQLPLNQRPSPGRGGGQPRSPRALLAPRSEPVPPAFLALLSWVGQAIGSDLVGFAAMGPEGWQTLCSAQAMAVGEGVVVGDHDGQRPSLAAEAQRYEGLLSAVAELRRPAELTKECLATVCPGLVARGIGSVVGAPVFGPSGLLKAVTFAAYRTNSPSAQLSAIESGARVGPETLGCMGKLLTAAHDRLRTLPAPASNDDEALADRLVANPHRLMLTSEVAALFSVSSRAVSNWVATGALPAVRTAGGHLRFRRADVLALYVGVAGSA